jgi:hypothetical protein
VRRGTGGPEDGPAPCPGIRGGQPVEGAGLGAQREPIRDAPVLVIRPPAASVNLDDPRFIDAGALRTYVTRILSRPRIHAAGWAADGKRNARVAAAVAPPRRPLGPRGSAGSRGGGRTRRAAVARPAFPHDAAEAMQYYLAALPWIGSRPKTCSGRWPSPAGRGYRSTYGRPWLAGSQEGRR